MYYLILFVSLFAFLILEYVVHRFFKKKEKLIIERILPFVLMAIFAVRFMSYNDIQLMTDAELAAHGLEGLKFGWLGGPMPKILNLVGDLLIWLEITAALFLFLRPFNFLQIIRHLTRFVAAPIMILCGIGLYPMLMMMQGTTDWTLLTVMLPIEIGGLLALGVYYWFVDINQRLNKVFIIKIIVMFVLLSFFTMPPFLPRELFGLAPNSVRIIDMSFAHRLVLYFLVAFLPIFIYFICRNQHKSFINYVLIFISVGTMLGFMTSYKYDSLLKPWSWPFHLCNTAMFLVPICYIFKAKKLFYFTYFINVLGALFAMLMPNYDAATNLFAPSLIAFWYNHMIAFWMPLLGVALKVFPRPKMKQYFLSVLWLFVYYVLVLFLNGLFGAIGHPTDYFFINSTFIADKLGSWAKDLFNNFIVSIPIKGHGNMVFHPVYQLIYFVTYIAMGFGVWFVYELFFKVADEHYELHMKLRGIKVDALALKSQLNGRSIDEPMDKDAGVSLKYIHFSKKYESAKHYAVSDANFEVYGGEVFGFLGPNGAGKSTIIKSTVGIQPIQEGAIEVCGYDCAKQPIKAKSLIGFVPDHYALYEKLSGREYLNYIADIYGVSQEDRDERLTKYIGIFQLEHAIDNKIKTYSHGMKQKITIMAALVHNPKIWILDEPLTGLDPTSIYQVKQCMKEHAKEGNIVFFSSHLIDIVEKLCDRVAIIKKGKIQCVKTVEEIEKENESLEKFYLDVIGDEVVER